MEIKVRTDRALRGGQELASFVGYEVVAGLGSCATRVANAVVEITEESGEQGTGRGLRCQLQVWPLGHAPVVVSRLAASGEAAVQGAVEDMRRVLERMFRRVERRD